MIRIIILISWRNIWSVRFGDLFGQDLVRYTFLLKTETKGPKMPSEPIERFTIIIIIIVIMIIHFYTG